jgi:hypothetical protein
MKKSLLGLMLGIILCFGTDQEALADGKKEPKNKVPVSGSRFSLTPIDKPIKAIITGAFGLKLGKRLDPSIVISENKKENTAKVKPIIPNKMFNDYSVTFAPKTKKIISIEASIKAKTKCPTDEFRGLKVLFDRKFNKPVANGPSVALYRWHGSNGREVEIVCLKNSKKFNNLFRITYREEKSSREGMIALEQIKLDLRSIDSSGL